MQMLIIGAGAVGGFYGAKLNMAGGNVTLLARGKILMALQDGPLRIKSYQGDFTTSINAVGSVDGLPTPELIILAVKTYDTAQALEALASVVGPETIFLSLQNGVESESKLATRFGAEKVLGAICYIGAEVSTPGEIVHSADGQVTLGELDGTESARLQKIHAIFKQAKIDVSISSDIKKNLWGKLLWNVPFNQVCATARASVGEVLDSPEKCVLMKAAMHEVVQIAQENGIALSEQNIDKHLEFSEQKLRAVRPSMLQDLERGKRLEHEAFSGFIVREGQRLGIATPINQTLYQSLCTLDPGGN